MWKILKIVSKSTKRLCTVQSSNKNSYFNSVIPTIRSSTPLTSAWDPRSFVRGPNAYGVISVKINPPLVESVFPPRALWWPGYGVRRIISRSAERATNRLTARHTLATLARRFARRRIERERERERERDPRGPSRPKAVPRYSVENRESMSTAAIVCLHASSEQLRTCET